ncbi:MAG TPA: hypothetical protein VFG42_21770 [Baekduia sp.]|uniref:hypothetical protein n=1 Tax=Baekduia sp. TaxID=2600305 RepID=UPI002D77A208|nr:hypothetical protein [Baekduia sp.]HET6509441.1 hypothetical protein [Baekduia sp.]
MPEPRAQRTLVKSPPEIWSEISDVSMLARHLGEFGEIRIASLEAETTVVWEGDTARGTVELEPSGWGTKVTIAAEAVAIEVDVEVEVEVEYEVEPEPAPEPEPVAEAPRQGFLARLFGRRAKAARPEPIVVPEPVAPIMATRIEKRVEKRSESLADERVEAVLVGVLDDLGSAHHRPFSRG